MRRTNISCRSEQIPTRVRLAVAEEFLAASGGATHRWRAGGILLQFVPRAPERARVADLDPGDAPAGTVRRAVREDDAWVEGRSLVETVEDVELIDPSLSSERLLYRLFHERGVRVFRSAELARSARARVRASRRCCDGSRRPIAGRDGRERQDFGDLRILQREPMCSQTERTRGRSRDQLRVRFELGLSSEKVG